MALLLDTLRNDFLEKDLNGDFEKGRSKGWFKSSPFVNAHVSAMGVVDKNDMGRPVGLRRIYNLSEPSGGRQLLY